MSTTTLQVRKDKLTETRLVTTEDAPLAPGQVRVRVEHFALTSNNITYAAFGDAMSYWQFWPTGEDGWGIVPVWGFAAVVQSLHPGVAVGERLYGYWPMADSALLQPGRLTAAGFSDAAPHRAEPCRTPPPCARWIRNRLCCPQAVPAAPGTPWWSAPW